MLRSLKRVAPHGVQVYNVRLPLIERIWSGPVRTISDEEGCSKWGTPRRRQNGTQILWNGLSVPTTTRPPSAMETTELKDSRQRETLRSSRRYWAPFRALLPD